MVGTAGFEPVTPSSQARCSSQAELSPEKRHINVVCLNIKNYIMPTKRTYEDIKAFIVKNLF